MRGDGVGSVVSEILGNRTALDVAVSLDICHVEGRQPACHADISTNMPVISNQDRVRSGVVA